MKKKLSILTILFFAFASICYANKKQTPELLSVTPDTIKMRHAQDVSIEISNWKPGTQISITPGGTYIQSEIEVEPIQTKFTSSGFIWVYTKNQLDVYNKDLVLIKSNKLRNNLQHFDIHKQTLIASTGKQLKVYQINNDFSINENKATVFKNKIIKTNLSTNHACLLLNTNQILQLNLNSGKTSQSVKQKQKIKDIFASKNACISISDNKQITLWEKRNEDLIVNTSYLSSDSVNEASINNDQIILANGNTGFTILNKKNNLQWLGSYNKLGNIMHISVDRHETLVADDLGAISLFDISNPENPLLTSDFHLQESITELAFKNSIAYAVTQNKLLKIDFSSKSTPIISTLGVNQGGSRRSFIKDNVLYVADWFSGLHLYDISITHAPRLLSSFHTPGSPKGVVVRKNTAFVADDDHGLQIVNVSNPHSPSLISKLPLSGLAYTMKLVDNLLYIAAHRGGFHIVDVSNETQPKLVSTYDTPSKAWALEYQSGLLYVADDSSGLMIFDVTKPEAPKLINQFDPGGMAEDVILKNNKAYIAFFDLGLVVLDISDPLKLKELSRLQTPGNARGIDIKNNLLYLASWEAGVLIIDISNDIEPQIIGHYDTKGATWGLSVDKHTLYAMDWWGGIKILDVNDAYQPIFISQYQTAGKIKDILYHNNFIYTAHGSRGLQIYDANNSLNPVWATGLDFDGDARAATLYNNLALIAAGDGGLVIADVTNPFQIKWLSQIRIPSSADFIQALNHTAFIATENGDLYSIDISNPKHPQITNRYASKTQSIKVTGETLYQLRENQSLKAYSVNKLTKKINIEELMLKSKADLMAINNHQLYLATFDGKIWLHDLSPNAHLSSSEIKLPEHLIALYLHNKRLFITTKSNKLYVFNTQNNGPIHLQSIYPSTHKIEQISASNDGIFFSGESMIASAKLLPEVSTEQNNSSYIIKIPNNMPLGAYNLNISTEDGEQKSYSNAFKVAFPKLKSKFSMEDFKRKMQQKNLPGKANSQL